MADTIHALVVEDSPTMRQLIVFALSRIKALKVTEADDGVDALKKLSGQQFDILITDINMPRMDGFGFIDTVRAQDKHRTTPILVLTTESGNELKQRARKSGATGWIVKPFDPNKLIKALQMVAG